MGKTAPKITLSPSRDIPFDRLRLSPSNVRRTRPGQTIADLADDIARLGLLQSLNVRPLGARQRRTARDALLVGLAEYAISNDIHTYTGVAELPWFRQIQTFGWDCRSLGDPVLHRGQALVGLRIDIDATTVAKLAGAGIVSNAAAASAACAA